MYMYSWSLEYTFIYLYVHFSISEEYHAPLLEEDPSAIGFLLGFMQHDDVSFVHLALWIMAQFSNGSELKTCIDYLYVVYVTQIKKSIYTCGTG